MVSSDVLNDGASILTSSTPAVVSVDRVSVLNVSESASFPGAGTSVLTSFDITDQDALESEIELEYRTDWEMCTDACQDGASVLATTPHIDGNGKDLVKPPTIASISPSRDFSHPLNVGSDDEDLEKPPTIVSISPSVDISHPLKFLSSDKDLVKPPLIDCLRTSEHKPRVSNKKNKSASPIRSPITILENLSDLDNLDDSETSEVFKRMFGGVA